MCRDGANAPAQCPSPPPRPAPPRKLAVLPDLRRHRFTFRHSSPGLHLATCVHRMRKGRDRKYLCATLEVRARCCEQFTPHSVFPFVLLSLTDLFVVFSKLSPPSQLIPPTFAPVYCIGILFSALVLLSLPTPLVTPPSFPPPCLHWPLLCTQPSHPLSSSCASSLDCDVSPLLAESKNCN